MPALRVVEGESIGERFTLSQGQAYAMGRAADCRIQLRDLGASREHCVVEPKGERWHISDLASHNGVFVNGLRIKAITLEPDDEITVGQTKFVFEDDRPRSDPNASTVRLPEAQIRAVLAKAGDPLVGAILGPYRLVRPIGIGGMGMVYEGVNTANETRVAVKVLQAEMAQEADLVKRFVRSAWAALSLKHPNIVKVTDVSCVSKHFLLVMELVEGNDLAAMLNRLDPDAGLHQAEAVRIAIELAKGLAFAHTQGTMHRDVKPANVLVARDGSVKLADLGLIKARDQSGLLTDITKTGMAMGTLGYVAPEQLLDAKHVDGRADVYSLGATLYHMLSGRPPFEGIAKDHLVQAILSGRVKPLIELCPHLPPRLCRVVAKAMAAKADDRYGDMDKLIRALRRSRSDEPEG